MTEKRRAPEVKQLRTLAEVDAEIATIVRMGFDSGTVAVTNPGGSMTDYVQTLCSELTSDGLGARCSECGELARDNPTVTLREDRCRRCAVCEKETADARTNPETFPEYEGQGQ